MAIIAILCLIGGLVFAPFSPIPNGLNANLTNSVTTARIEVPSVLLTFRVNQTLYFVPDRNAEFTFALSGDAIIAGKPLQIDITMLAQPVIARHVPIIIVKPDNALAFPLFTDQITKAPAFAAIPLMQEKSTPYLWKGYDKVYYAQPGIFGATILFATNDSATATNTYFNNTGPVIEIGSPDTIIAKQNEALTTSLTFFVLMFAAIEVRAETHQDQFDKTYENGTVDDQSRNYVKRSVRLVKGKVAAKEHPDRISRYHKEKTKRP